MAAEKTHIFDKDEQDDGYVKKLSGMQEAFMKLLIKGDTDGQLDRLTRESGKDRADILAAQDRMKGEMNGELRSLNNRCLEFVKDGWPREDIRKIYDATYNQFALHFRQQKSLIDAYEELISMLEAQPKTSLETDIKDKLEALSDPIEFRRKNALENVLGKAVREPSTERENPFLGEQKEPLTDDELALRAIEQYENEIKSLQDTGMSDPKDKIRWINILNAVDLTLNLYCHDHSYKSRSNGVVGAFETLRSDLLKKIVSDKSFDSIDQVAIQDRIDIKTTCMDFNQSRGEMLSRELPEVVASAKASYKGGPSRFDNMKHHIGEMLKYPGGFHGVCQYIQDNKSSINRHRDYTGWLRQHVFGGRVTDTYMTMLRTLAEKAPRLEKSKMTKDDLKHVRWLERELSTHGVKLELQTGIKSLQEGITDLYGTLLNHPSTNPQDQAKKTQILTILSSLKNLRACLSQAQVKSSVSDPQHTISLYQTCRQMVDDCERLAGSKDDGEAIQLRTDIVSNIDDLLRLSEVSYKRFYDDERETLMSIKTDIGIKGDSLTEPSPGSGGP